MISRSLLALLPLALAACAHGPAGAPTARTAAAAAFAKATDVFPSKPGTVWKYDVVGHPVGEPDVDIQGSEVVELESAKRVNGRTVLKLRELDDFTGRYRYPVLSWDEDGVQLADVTYWGPMASDAPGHALALLQLPLAAGKRWDDGLWIGEVKGKEAVTVPAGTFEAFKIGVIGTYEDAYTAVGTYWIAPGTGIVKSELTTPVGSFDCALIPANRAVRKATRAFPLPKKK